MQLLSCPASGETPFCRGGAVFKMRSDCSSTTITVTAPMGAFPGFVCSSGIGAAPEDEEGAEFDEKKQRRIVGEFANLCRNMTCTQITTDRRMFLFVMIH